MNLNKVDLLLKICAKKYWKKKLYTIIVSIRESLSGTQKKP